MNPFKFPLTLLWNSPITSVKSIAVKILLLAGLLSFSFTVSAQQPVKKEKWKMNGNKWLTGSLVFTAGAARGFNETLVHHWKGFHHIFPDANAQWFNPEISWRNKYEDGNPDGKERFPLSTSVLVMFTDQYHLNNFINRAAWTSTLVLKICEGKKPFIHYVYDFIYYTICNLLGFSITYYPFAAYRAK
jgi:hypothetical protein